MLLNAEMKKGMFLNLPSRIEDIEGVDEEKFLSNCVVIEIKTIRGRVLQNHLVYPYNYIDSEIEAQTKQVI